MLEEWRAVVGYEGRYEVSNYGAIRSLCSRRYSHATDENGEETRLMQPDRHWRGYLRVQLYPSNGCRKWKRVHSLVAEAFIGPRPDPHPTEGDFTVDHLNEDKTDNVYTNLEWVTKIENHRRHYERNRAALQQDE
jgi:hypothetical protein